MFQRTRDAIREKLASLKQSTINQGGQHLITKSDGSQIYDDGTGQMWRAWVDDEGNVQASLYDPIQHQLDNQE